MDYRVIRSGRKTVCIQLTDTGEVVVRAPRRCSEEYIRRFVESHRDWIESHRRALLDRNARRDGFSLTEGMEISLCGETVPVHIVPGLRPRLFRGQLILPDGDMDRVRGELLRLAKEQGMPWLRARLDRWAADMGLSYRELKCSTARARWGSCSAEGVIRISVFLLFAPERAIDYVLVHELAHRRHFDHSPAFWRTVEAAMPDYREQKAVLRRFQQEPLIQSLAAKEGTH